LKDVGKGIVTYSGKTDGGNTTVVPGVPGAKEEVKKIGTITILPGKRGERKGKGRTRRPPKSVARV